MWATGEDGSVLTSKYGIVAGKREDIGI